MRRMATTNLQGIMATFQRKVDFGGLAGHGRSRLTAGAC